MDSFDKNNVKNEFLSVEELTTLYVNKKSFIRAVDGISFSIFPQQVVGLAGESGSGKTQTALSILNLLDGFPGIVKGKIWIEGQQILQDLEYYCQMEYINNKLNVHKDVSGWAKVHEARVKKIRGHKIAMIFQEPKSALSPYFTVGQQLDETLIARFGEKSKDKIVPLLEKLQFKDTKRILNTYPHQLSGGESQRIMLALALLGHPKLVIADEPTTQLDALTQFMIIDLFQSIIEETKSAFFFITHNLALISILTDFVLIMFAGKIVETGPTRIIVDRATKKRHPYTQNLLLALPDWSEKKINQNQHMHLATERNDSGCCYYFRCTLKDKLGASEQKQCRYENPPRVSISENHSIYCWHTEK